MVDGVVFVGAVVALLVVLVVSRNVHEIAIPGAARDADGYVHMVIAREFRERGHRVPRDVSANVFDWTFSYPYLVHLLLSFLPERHYETVDRVFPTAMDLLYVGLLAALVPLGLLDRLGFLLVLALFVTAPQFIQYSAGKGLSARKPGILLGTLSFLSFYLWTAGGGTWLLVASAVLGGLTHLTSRFGTQAIAFFYLGFALLYPIAIAVIVASFVAAVALSLGAYVRILRSHFIFWYNYAVQNQFVFLYDGFKSVDTLRRFLRSRSLSDVLSAVYESVLLKALLNNPFALAAAAVVAWSLRGPALAVPPALVVWFAAGLALCVLTTSYGLRFLGQPGRYLNFAFVPGALLVVEGYSARLPAHRLLLGVVFALGLAMIAGQALSHWRLGESEDGKRDLDGAVEFLNSQGPTAVVVQPRFLGSEVAWKAPSVGVTDFFGDGYCSRTAKRESQRVVEHEPFLTGDVDTISEVVDPSWVLFDREKLASTSEAVLRPPNCDPAFENESYSVYRWSDLTAESAE